MNPVYNNCVNHFPSEFGTPFPYLDLKAMNLFCLAQLQETAEVLRNTLVSVAQLNQLPGQRKAKKTFNCDFEGCEKVNSVIS